MRRRSLIIAATALAAEPAVAGETAPGAAVLNISGVGLPVIEGGRLRNYVFVSLRLHLGAGKTPEQMRAKEPFIRDALVRAAHRTPFVVPGDWMALNPATLAATTLRVGRALAGAGAVTRVEIVSQTPRRRTGVPTR
jgi:hypothetical protein